MKRTKNCDGIGYLYFVRGLTLDAVKVGFAVDPYQRLPSIQTGNHHELYVGTIVPIEFDAEHDFHELMRPHRISREWYPDDGLMAVIDGELIETWGDKVQEKNGGSHEAWLVDRDEWENPAGVYLTARETVCATKLAIGKFFNPDLEDLEPGDDEYLRVTNHWLPQPKPKVRKLRPGYV